jgi:hypothetical protein
LCGCTGAAADGWTGNLILIPTRVTDSLSSVPKGLDECDTFLSLQRVLVKKATSYELVLKLLWCVNKFIELL